MDKVCSSITKSYLSKPCQSILSPSKGAVPRPWLCPLPAGVPGEASALTSAALDKKGNAAIPAPRPATLFTKLRRPNVAGCLKLFFCVIGRDYLHQFAPWLPLNASASEVTCNWRDGRPEFGVSAIGAVWKRNGRATRAAWRRAAARPAPKQAVVARGNIPIPLLHIVSSSVGSPRESSNLVGFRGQRNFF